MRTEIVIPFAFDTAPIEQMLEKVGEDEVLKRIDEITREYVLSAIPKETDGWGYGTDKPDWRAFVTRRVDAFLDRHSEKIIDEAALLLAMRSGSKRKWRDVLKEYKEEMA